MTHLPLVSIIIPTYNRAKLIGETLDSILAQTYKNWECLVVDDGSTDDTKKLVSNYVAKDDRFQYHERPDTHLPGGNGARNYGFELSKGEYVQWFDSDDLMLPEKLELKVETLVNNDVDFVVCSGAEMSENSINPQKKWDLYLTENTLFDHLIGNIVFGTNGPMFNRAFLTLDVLFNETLLIKQEWEFFNRLLMNKPSIKIIEKVLYVYRVFPESKRGTFTYSREQNKMKAHRLVFNMVKSNTLFTKEQDFLFRKYFQKLFLKHYKLSLQYKKYKDTWYVLGSMRRTFTMLYFFEVGKRIVKKPEILKNLLYHFSNFKRREE